MISRNSASRFVLTVLVVLLWANGSDCLSSTVITSDANSVNKLVIHTEAAKDTISPEIYGHFAEHLGRCIYEGFWVGPDSPIPNVRGIRKDLVEALRKLNIPVLRWPGGCFADEYHWRE